jgi:hypothetical protein
MIFVGEAYQAWEHIFHLDAGQALPPERIVDDDGQGETASRDVRERMRGIERERCQHWKNGARALRHHKRLLCGPQFTIVEDVNASCAELRQHAIRVTDCRHRFSIFPARTVGPATTPRRHMRAR